MKKVIFTIVIVIVIAILGIGMYVKFALPNVGAAPDLKVDISADHVARGKYLANHVSVCIDCHSTRDWGRFSGPIIPGTEGKGGEYFGPELGFPGKFYSKNITPFHLKDWTDGEIFRTITTGENKDGKALFPVMPYAYYGRMDKEDLYDIVAYVRSLPTIDHATPERKINFPVNFIVNTIPQKASFSTKPPKSDTLAYGAYMTNAAGCMECHTPVNSKGQIKASLAFIGGRSFKMPGGVTNSANLTPDKETGIGDWTAEMFVTRFRAYNDPSESPKISSTEPNTPMPWMMYAGMDTTDLRAIFTYLKSLKPVNHQVTHFVFASSASNK